MRAFHFTATVALAPVALALSGCGEADTSVPTPILTKGEPSPAITEAAQLTVIFDVSGSVAALTNPDFGKRAIALATAEFGNFRLGDSARVVVAGDRSVANAVNPPLIKTGYKLRLPAARRQLEEQLHGVLAQHRTGGGDNSTNLITALENAQPVCTSSSEVVVISDMIEQSETYSVTNALSANQPIRLPAPTQPYLRGGCIVKVIGIGVLGGGTQAMLPNAQLRSLQKAWDSYFRSAGASDIQFRSII